MTRRTDLARRLGMRRHHETDWFMSTELSELRINPILKTAGEVLAADSSRSERRLQGANSSFGR